MMVFLLLCCMVFYRCGKFLYRKLLRVQICFEEIFDRLDKLEHYKDVLLSAVEELRGDITALRVDPDDGISGGTTPEGLNWDHRYLSDGDEPPTPTPSQTARMRRRARQSEEAAQRRLRDGSDFHEMAE